MKTIQVREEQNNLAEHSVERGNDDGRENEETTELAILKEICSQEHKKLKENGDEEQITNSTRIEETNTRKILDHVLNKFGLRLFKIPREM